MIKLTRACVLAVLLGAGPVDRRVGAGEAELARARAEFPAAAHRLDDAFAHVRGSASSWYENPRDTRKSLQTEARFAIDLPHEKVEIFRFSPGAKPGKLPNMVYCVGDDTAFQLYRRPIDPTYQVKGIGATPDDRKAFLNVFSLYGVAHHGVMGRRLTQVIADPGFAILAAEDMVRGGTRLVRLDCASGPAATRDQFSLTVEPDAGWAVRECRYRSGTGLRETWLFEIEYGGQQDGVPLPRRVKLMKPDDVVVYWDYTNWAFTPTPPTEFTMTYYDLPDLVAAHRARNPLPYWLAGFAVVAGVLAYLSHHISARRDRSARA